MRAPSVSSSDRNCTTPAPMNCTPTQTSRKPITRVRAVIPVVPSTATMRRALRSTSHDEYATSTMPSAMAPYSQGLSAPAAMPIVTAIEPGPLSIGMARGVKARSVMCSASSRWDSLTSGSGSGFSMPKPIRATIKPPAMRSAGIEMPKNSMISAPANSDTSSTIAM